jgi:arylsulfatase A-like enzyme
MSYYTGRYVFSHGATWNRVPLSLREKTIGDYLRPAGIRVALAGKTHVLPDLDGLERYGIEGASAIAALMRAGRFEELDRYDGHSPPGEESGYADYLRKQGYNADDPWSDYVISADGPDGPVSGWHMRNVHRASSRTWATSRGSCISATSSRTGPIWRPRPTTRCTAPRTACRSIATSAS